jgi:cell shape-determining protein MreC
MRVNSHRTSRNKKIVRIAVLGASLVVLLVLVPMVALWFSSLLLTPVAKTKTWLAESTSSFPLFFRDRTELINRISTLESALAGAGGNQFTIDSLAQENEDLRSLLGYEGEERILAGIIGRPSQLPYDVLMLDRGSADGVTEGAPVYINDSTVIGLVRAVTPYSSVAELITTPGFETTVYIIGPDIYTTAVGNGGGQMRVGVPQGINLTVGDLVVIPSVTSGVYGAITHIETSPTQPEQYGYVATTIPLGSMRLVSIGKTPVQPISFAEAQAILAQQKERLFVVPVPDTILIDLEATSTSTSTDAFLPAASPSTTNAI